MKPFIPGALLIARRFTVMYITHVVLNRELGCFFGMGGVQLNRLGVPRYDNIEFN